MVLLLPRLLKNISDRVAMLTGAFLLVVGLLLGTWLSSYYWLLPLWLLLGIGYSLAQTPSGRLLRRSSNEQDRPALFAGQFALSHTCWLITYPVAGWIGSTFGLTVAFVVLGMFAALTWLLATVLWPKKDFMELEHSHDLPLNHSHFIAHLSANGKHQHVFVIDDLHERWPSL
jgi:MFS family permease